MLFGDVVQLVERMLCKHEVIGSSPIVSNFKKVAEAILSKNTKWAKTRLRFTILKTIKTLKNFEIIFISLCLIDFFFKLVKKD